MPKTSLSKNGYQFRINPLSTSIYHKDNRVQPNLPSNLDIPSQHDLEYKFRLENHSNTSFQQYTSANEVQVSNRKNDLTTQSLKMLDNDWNNKVEATTVWPQSISDNRVKDCFLKFYVSQNNVPVFTCGVCALLVEDSQCFYWLVDSLNPSKVELLLTDEFGNLCIDNCGKKTTESGSTYIRTCYQCWRSLEKDQLPLFCIRTGFDYGCFSDMPNYLKNLTLVEERLISPFRTYGFIAKIIKNHISIANYRKTKGHIIVIPQDPAPLFTILPSRELRLYEVVKVMWVGKEKPTHAQLGASLQVRKEVVRIALLGLKQHNPLYANIEIDHQLLNEWPESFIPSELVDSMVLIDDVEGDTAERSGYSDEVFDSDVIEEEDLEQSIEETFSTSGLTSVDFPKDSVGVSLIPALLSASKKTSSPQPPSDNITHEPMIQVRPNTSVIVNDYTEPRLFPGTFPTLFWKKQPGHLDHSSRECKISFHTWFSSLLKHHTRRFSRHPTFIHVAFDIANRHKVNSAANIVVKRRDWTKRSMDIHQLTIDQLNTATQQLKDNLPVTIEPVFSLLSSCTSIGQFIPLSHENRQRMRANIKANIIRFGLPAIWLTINPSDLTHPMLCRIAGISLSPSLGLTSSQVQNLKVKTATTNPVASAQFFHKMITSFFDTLVMPYDQQPGIFGDIESYFSTTETNGRGSLHLHGFLWLRGNIGIEKLRERILNNQDSKYILTTNNFDTTLE